MMKAADHVHKVLRVDVLIRWIHVACVHPLPAVVVDTVECTEPVVACGGSESSFISSMVSEAMRRICFLKAGGVLGRDGCEGSDVRRGPLLCLERRSLRNFSCLGRSIMALCMGCSRPLIAALYIPLVSRRTL